MLWIRYAVFYCLGCVTGMAAVIVLLMYGISQAEPLAALPVTAVVAQAALPTMQPATSTPMPQAFTATPTPTPTFVPTPVPTPQPVRPTMGDTEKLLRVFLGQTFVSAMLHELATQVQSQQMSGLDALMGLALASAMLDGLAPGVDYGYFPPLRIHAEIAKTQQSALRSTVQRWANQEITSADIANELATVDPQNETFRLVETLKASGVSQTEIEGIISRLDADIQAAFASLQTAP